jgi:mRNA interferase HigB
LLPQSTCIENSSRTPSIRGLTASQIVKYSEGVYIVTRRHLSEAMKQYSDAASEVEAWTSIVEAVRWHNFAEVREMLKDADYVNGYVVFNIRRNRYRLITVIHYAKTTGEKQTEGHVYIRSFLTHKEYDNLGNWDRRFGTK